MRAFAASIDAREVNVRDQPANINTKADLVALRARFDV
jgi:molybdopterin-guanine dinucleotide biosynthesis protein A